ncbi:MAG: phosphosulfolactate synthase [Bacteroidales bacterium]
MIKLLPERKEKPRHSGVTMIMDKGLGLRQAQDLVETSGHLIDFIKLGFGTSLVCRQVKDKAWLYREHDIKVYVGGTLFEAFLVRDQLDEYLEYIEELGCDAVEISDGCIRISQEEKCRIIRKLAEDYTVVSEVGAKTNEVVMAAGDWVEAMNKELEAGSSFVIGEARESGTVGIYGKDGCADEALIQEIVTRVPGEKVIWEAPAKHQQKWFIQLLGTNVNLGNIAPDEIAALETLRLGLRGDTFFNFLPDYFNERKR